MHILAYYLKSKTANSHITSCFLMYLDKEKGEKNKIHIPLLTRPTLQALLSARSGLVLLSPKSPVSSKENPLSKSSNEGNGK